MPTQGAILGSVARHQKEFIALDDAVRYKRCRVQLHAKGIVLRDELEGAAIKTKKQQVCRTGQFLVAEIDAKLGGYGIVPEDLDGAIVSSHYFLFDVDLSKLDRAFLGYFIRTPYFHDQVGARGSTNYAAIRPAHVLAYRIPLPPMAEQRRIVAKIDALAAKIEEARGLRAHIAAQLTALVTAYHFQAAREEVLLADILELHENQVSVESDRQYPQIGIRGFGGGLFGKPALSGTETTYKRFNRLFDGAVVLSQVKGWEGAIGVCPRHLCSHFASPEYRTFRCRAGRSRPDYLDAVLKTPWFLSLLNRVSRGVGARRERTRPEDFLALRLPMPSLYEQTKFINVIKRLDELKVLQAETAAELDALLPSILDKAFKGEL